MSNYTGCTVRIGLPVHQAGNVWTLAQAVRTAFPGLRVTAFASSVCRVALVVAAEIPTGNTLLEEGDPEQVIDDLRRDVQKCLDDVRLGRPVDATSPPAG
jgi:hypothetical protein